MDMKITSNNEKKISKVKDKSTDVSNNHAEGTTSWRSVPTTTNGGGMAMGIKDGIKRKKKCRDKET